jgi:flagellar biosynthesis protein FliQ
MGFMEEAQSSSLVSKAIAAVVLLVGAWILLKLVIGMVAAVFWTALAIAAILAVAWAVLTLRS